MFNKIPRFKYLTPSKMYPSQWEFILSKAKSVVTSLSGLKESLEKRDRLVMYLRGNELIGLTSFNFLPWNFNNSQVIILFQGNTWLSPTWRGRNINQILATLTLLELYIKYPLQKKYFFAACSNYKSYLFLTKNTSNFWPNPGQETPDNFQQLIHQLSDVFYPGEYNPKTKLIESPGERGFQDNDVNTDDGEKRNRYIQFYLEKNPDYRNGKKLPCLVNISFLEFSAIGKNVLLRFLKNLKP